MTQILEGSWTGSLIYSKDYRLHAGKTLYFEMDLMHSGNEFIGKAKDTGGTGMSPDPADILGTFSENKIRFLKQYATSHYYMPDGSTEIDRTQKGPVIVYTGVFDPVSQEFSGDWIIKTRYLLFFIIPLVNKSRGTWTMKRKEN